jgi:hypothetical protein
MVISLQTLCFLHLHSKKVLTNGPHAVSGAVNASLSLWNLQTNSTAWRTDGGRGGVI